MIEVRQYNPEDYMRISRRTFDMVTFLNFPDPWETARNLAKGPAFTGVNSEHIIACGGIVPLWRGVGEAWVVTSSLVEKHPIIFSKVVARRLKTLISIMDLERVQTTIHCKHKRSMKWAEKMGFKKEGLMKKYISGENFYRYALIRGK